MTSKLHHGTAYQAVRVTLFRGGFWLSGWGCGSWGVTAAGEQLATTEWYILGLAVCSPEVILATHMFSSDRVFYPRCSLCSLLRKLAYQSVIIHRLQTIQAHQSPADYTSSLATASSSNPNHHILSTFIDKCVNFFKSQPRHPVSTTYMYNSILNNLHCSVLHLSLTKHPHSSISTSMWTVLATIKSALQSVSNQHWKCCKLLERGE